MAIKIQTTDDLDGTILADDATPVLFTVNGQSYRLDLTDTNKQRFAKAIQKYIDAATPVKAEKPKNAKPKKRDDLDAIRTWANKHGYTVADRGRIAADIVAAYDAWYLTA